MPNRVFLSSDGLIVNRYVGDQTGASVRKIVVQIEVLSDKLRSEKKPVLLLTDLTQIGKQDTSAREAASVGLKLQQFDLVAIYGKDPILRYITSLVVRASGKTATAKYFDSKEKAISFLLSEGKAIE